MILPLLPIFCKEIGISSVGYGIIVGAVGLSRFLSNVPAGWLADKFGRRPLLISGPAITAIGIVGMGLSSSFFPFLGCRILTGVGGALDMTAGQLYLSDISTPKNRARIFAPAVIAFSSGSVVGPAVGGWLAGHFSIQIPFFVVSTCIVGVVLINYLVLPETKKKLNLESKKKLDSSISIYKQLKEMLLNCKPLIKQRDIRSILYVHSSFWFASSSCIYTMLPLLGTENLLLTPSEVALWYVSLAIFNIVGTTLSAKISDKYGRKVTLVPSTILIGIATFLMPFVSSYAHLTALVCLWGCGGALFGANTSAYIIDKTTERTRSHALVLLRSCSDLGLMLGGIFAGTLNQYVSSNSPFLLAAFLVSAAGAHMAIRASDSFFISKSRQKSSELSNAISQTKHQENNNNDDDDKLSSTNFCKKEQQQQNDKNSSVKDS